MTKHDLVEQLAYRNHLSKREAELVLYSLVDIVSTNMVRGEKTSITGFGTFDLGKRAARRGVDPQTGAEIHIPEMPMPRFRAGQWLKEAVRSKVKAAR